MEGNSTVLFSCISWKKKLGPPKYMADSDVAGIGVSVFNLDSCSQMHLQLTNTDNHCIHSEQCCHYAVCICESGDIRQCDFSQ